MKTPDTDFDTAPSTIHPFVKAPHATLVRYSIPVLFSLVAEPLTGLVDTAFVAKLGSEPLAALGVGTAVLSSLFWVFNFLSIGTQTEVAQAMGRNNREQLRQITGLALSLAVVFGIGLIVLVYFLSGTLVDFMGAKGAVHTSGVLYTNVRLYGAPAVLISFVGFGAMRGCQNMTTPLWVAGGINILNIVLDPLMIFGWGFVPAMGVAGAALASVISQWVGAFFCIVYIVRQAGCPGKLDISQALALLKVGRDLFVRTGMLTLFLLLTTRSATAIGPAAGAAHQAIRQTWIFTAFLMDAYAISGQSLVAYFLGSGAIIHARRVASVVCIWCLATGIVLSVAMIIGQQGIVFLFVPADAVVVFSGPWLISALMQPVSSLAFATDGIHWGTGDFRYLRNGVVLATVIAGLILTAAEYQALLTLNLIWVITAGWVAIRTIVGIIRIWPGIGNSPLALTGHQQKTIPDISG